MRRQRVPWQVKFGSLAIIWGASFLFMKIGLRWFSPVQIATGRVVLGAATVVLLLHLTGGRLPRSWHVWRHLLVVAVFLASLPFVLFPLGEERVSSALAGIGNAITPIATVLAMHPSLLVLDEPSANLDPRTRRELIETLDEVDRTMLIVTHDLPLAARLCERSVLLSGGRVVADAPTHELLADEQLLAAHDLELPEGFDLKRLSPSASSRSRPAASASGP